MPDFFFLVQSRPCLLVFGPLPHLVRPRLELLPQLLDDLMHRLVRQRVLGVIVAVLELQLFAPRIEQHGVLRDDLLVLVLPRHEAFNGSGRRAHHVPVQILTRGGGESEGRTRDEAPLSG